MTFHMPRVPRDEDARDRWLMLAGVFACAFAAVLQGVRDELPVQLPGLNERSPETATSPRPIALRSSNSRLGVPLSHGARLRSLSSWRWARASAYSRADSPGTVACTGRPLSDVTLTFAALSVPCGARVTFCVRGRCVTATRNDSGPYANAATFDLALGTVRALGFGSARAFGVRDVRWRRA